MSKAARVLVTGAGGALGGHAARLLAERGAEVYGTRRQPRSPGTIAPQGVHWLTCDLSKPDEARAAVEASRPAQVLHTVGLSGTSDFGALIEANVIALTNLVHALGDSAIQRLVVMGSAAEYATAGGRDPIREDDPLAPSNDYGLTKLFQFEISRKAYRAGLPVVYARPFNLIGPGVSCVTALGDITSRIVQLIRLGGGELEVGDLDRWRDYLDVRDAAAGCVVLLQDGEPGGVYNLCSGVPTLMSEVVDQLLSMTGDNVRLRRIEREESERFVVGDPTRLRTLGWSPAYDVSTSLRDGLQAMLAAGGADK
ncbi:MAG TPA: NAD(P)-dependent oxidoreductase [Candidatus Dormibacteraeota bacterium]